MQVSNKGEINFADLLIKSKSLFAYLFSKWLIILSFCGLAGIVGVTYVWLKKPQYTAELIFSAETGGDSKMGSYAGIAAQFGIDIANGGGSFFQGDNLTELLKMRFIIQKVLLSKNPSTNNGQLMIESYMRNNNLFKKWDVDASLDKINFLSNTGFNSRLKDSIINVVYARISKKQLIVEKVDKKLNFVTVSMTDCNEQFAKDFAEMLVQNTVDYYVFYRTQKSKSNVDVLTHQADSVKNVLFGGITNIAQGNDLNVNPIRQIVKVSSQKKQVDIQAATLVYGELLKNLELAKIALLKDTPLVQIIDRPVMPLKNNKTGRLLMGIIFSAVAFFLIVGYLTIRIWIIKGIAKHKKAQ
jgi:hypothetical protein